MQFYLNNKEKSDNKFTLLIHHFDSFFEEGFSNYNTDMDELSCNIIDFILSNQDVIGNVIFTEFEYKPKKDYQVLNIINTLDIINIPHEIHTYAYGFYNDNNEVYLENDFNDKWIYGTRDHHTEDDVLEIHDWQKDLKDKNVILIGGFHNECLLDMETILNHVGVKNKDFYFSPLCVGSNEQYINTIDSNLYYLKEAISTLETIDSFISNDLNNSFNIGSMKKSDAKYLNNEINQFFKHIDSFIKSCNQSIYFDILKYEINNIMLDFSYSSIFFEKISNEDEFKQDYFLDIKNKLEFCFLNENDDYNSIKLIDFKTSLEKKLKSTKQIKKP